MQRSRRDEGGGGWVGLKEAEGGEGGAASWGGEGARRGQLEKHYEERARERPKDLKTLT